MLKLLNENRIDAMNRVLLLPRVIWGVIARTVAGVCLNYIKLNCFMELVKGKRAVGLGAMAYTVLSLRFLLLMSKNNYMKVIVSTKVFALTIRKAIELRCETFEFNPETKDLVFNYDLYICMDCHISDKHRFGREQFTFDTIQMFKVLNFLNELQEQPIVVEFSQYEDDKLSIELTQFVRIF